MKELSETGWKKPRKINVFMAHSLQNITTVAESWKEVRTCENIYYYPKKTPYQTGLGLLKFKQRLLYESFNTASM